MSDFTLKIINNKYILKHETHSKFKNDNCFFEDESISCFINGVILNKSSLITKNKNWKETISILYNNYGELFFNQFRGSFLGFIYIKSSKKHIIFTDHIGSKHIYYLSYNNTFIFSSNISNIYEYINNNNLKNTLNKNAAYMLLSYGYTLGELTLSKSIKKILPGNYISLKNNLIKKYEYYKLKNTPNNKITEDEAIEKMDFFFKQAIKRQFNKDKEYNFNHFVALSGGLDSRMTSWVAHEIGYQNQLNFTFSQSDYLDETIPKKTASDLKHEWIFKSLDNGLFLFNIDEVTKITGGNVLYYTLAHSLFIFKNINFKNLGIIHSGQLGDVVFGTFYKSKDQKVKIDDGAYSKKLIHKVNFNDVNMKFENQEIFIFYNRGFSGANYGLLAAQKFTETISPFYDIDLLNFALTIPVEFRKNQSIYKKWILKKHAKAANYLWEATKSKINSPIINIFGRKIPKDRVLSLIKYKLGISKEGIKTKNHMNPLDYWLNTNKELENFFHNYFKNNIDLIIDSELKKDTIQLFNQGTSMEKIQCLSLLSALKLFF